MGTSFLVDPSVPEGPAVETIITLMNDTAKQDIRFVTVNTGTLPSAL